MKALKWIAVGVGGWAAVIGAILAAVSMITADAAGAASEFLKLVSESRYEEAYQATTREFRQQIRFDNFRDVITLDKVETVTWNSRTITIDGGVKLEGVIKTRNSGTVDVTVRLEWTGGGWKVYGVTLQREVVTASREMRRGGGPR